MLKTISNEIKNNHEWNYKQSPMKLKTISNEIKTISNENKNNLQWD